MAKKLKKGGCSGKDCGALGDAFREVDGSCASGIDADLLKELVKEAARNGKAEAREDCEGDGCECAGRFHVTTIGRSPIEEQGGRHCVWYVAGTWQGTCEKAGTVVEGPTQEELGRIHTRREFRPPAARPPGPCGGKPCRGLASAHITVAENPADGLDSEIILALIERATAAAEGDASSRCAKDCGCNGSFKVTDRGVEEVRIHGRTRYTWWVGGVFRGNCQEVV